MHRATIAQCVLWAKDRMIDDYELFIRDFNDGGDLGKEEFDLCGCAANFAHTAIPRRNAFVKAITKFAKLLALPNTKLESLKALQKAGYFNGLKDTMFEHCDPPKGYKG